MADFDVGELFTASLERMERLLSSKSVVGEQITIEGSTIIPLLSTGFGFGVGGGSGTATKGEGGEGAGGGVGGGGGIKPVAVVIVNKDGVEVVRIAKPSTMARVAEVVADVVQKRREKAEDEKGEEE